jgi:Resolvase, N terminal domain
MNAVAVDAVAGAHNNRSRHCKGGFSGARLRRGRQCDHGAFLRILEPAISTDGPMGKMVLTVLGMVAEMELGFIKARQRDGIERQNLRAMATMGANRRSIVRQCTIYLARELVRAKLPGVSRLGAPPSIGFWNCKAILGA